MVVGLVGFATHTPFVPQVPVAPHVAAVAVVHVFATQYPDEPQTVPSPQPPKRRPPHCLFKVAKVGVGVN